MTAVNGVKTPDLDSFIKAVNVIPNNTYFRIRAVSFDNVPWVITMKKNDHYVSFINYLPHYLAHSPSKRSITNQKQFPMSEYIKDPSAPLGWRIVSYTPDAEPRGKIADVNNVNADSMMEDVNDDAGELEPETK